ncbi:NAD(P)-dependent oxidoreductase [Kutzneria sp. NPDC052558]|uniref:NAD(P)-dependent oxidoreductase n=1 Tax=Kutzneria sp. NPDC052558 TaxID=3364121 RepID=UPI0037C93E06
MRLAVIGASGRIGAGVVEEALGRGHAVTAVVRDPSTFDRGTPVVRGDVFSPKDIAAAVADSDVVVSAIGHAATLDDAGYYARAACSLVEALRSTGSGRLLVVGGFGALLQESGAQFADEPRIPEHARPEIAGQRDALTYLRSVSDVRWTYLCPPPGGIWPGGRGGSYRLGLDRLDGRPADSRVTLPDFAVAVLDEAEQAAFPFACLGVAGLTPPSGASSDR